MSYVVHENFGPHKYTRIHGGGCHYADTGGAETQNPRWHPVDGGYATLDDAQVGMDRQAWQLVCKPCVWAGRLPPEVVERWVWEPSRA